MRTIAIQKLKQSLEQVYGSRLVRFIIFGSYARSEASEESDIDVFITLKGPVPGQTEEAIFNLAYGVGLEYDAVFDIKVFSEDDVQHTIIGRTPFVERVLAEGIPI